MGRAIIRFPFRRPSSGHLLPATLLLLASVGGAAGGVAKIAAESEKSPPGPYYSERVELRFRVTAQIETTTLDARVEAGARLLLERTEEGRRLSLVEVLEPGWKLYRVDPLGPGSEAKMAGVMTLPEGSWPAVEAARGALEARAAQRWAKWEEKGWTQSQSFDGTFAFLVLGPAAGRFEIDLTSDGRTKRVENRLTDRWTPGDLDTLLRDWDSRSGYWFWNGEAEPFEWEPHVFHALVPALELLEAPFLPEGDTTLTGSEELKWTQAAPGVGERALRVLNVLVPKSRGRLRVPTVTPTLESKAQRVPGDRWVLVSVGREETGSDPKNEFVFAQRNQIFDIERRTAIVNRTVVVVRTKRGWVQVEVELRSLGSSP